MLCVRIDGHEVETTPGVLAALVFDGKADRRSPARLADGLTEQPLEQLLGLPQGEALAGELHRRLRRMCSLDSAAVDVQELCTRVESLCQWRWASPPLAARFFWTAGWLNELMDRSKSALDFYNAFLLLPCREPHLRLLALNNRGVLRIRLGRLDGVEDLARAATGDCGLRIADCGLKEACMANPQSPIRDPQSVGLPAACFNLLNLINVSLGTAALLRAVDEELTDFFARLPEEVRAGWLGEDPVVGSRYSVVGEKENATDYRLPATDYRLPILRDPTYRRLNALTVRLAAQAKALTAESYSPADRTLPVFRSLSLWDCGPEDEARGSVGSAPAPRGRAPGNAGVECAEAASLLVGNDIPSLLTRAEDPMARVEQAAQEELASVEGHLASGRYELAKTRLQAQRRILSSLPGRGAGAVLLTRVEALLERVASLEAQEEQLRLQKTCAGFVAEGERFGTLSDLGQARRALEDLCGRLQQFRAQALSRTGVEVVRLLDELAERSRRHLRELEWAEIAKKIGDQPGPDSWERVEDELAQTLSYDPDAWSMVAPLFGLSEGDCGWEEPHDGNPPSAIRHPHFTLVQAGHLLAEALQRMGTDAGRCLSLWQGVERTLSSALAGGDLETLARARRLAEEFLDHWPAGLPEAPGRADPRNPVNRFLGACEKAQGLIEAQRWLESTPPRFDRAHKQFAALLRCGLDSGAQLRRVVTGLYLAQFHAKDAPPLQTQVLAGLERWAEMIRPEGVPQIREQEIVEVIERVRESVREV